VKIRLRNFPAKQLISHIEDTSYDNAPYNEAITSSHLWFTSSSQLIKVWCQRFEKSKKKNRLLTFLFIFLSYPHGTLTLKEIKNLQTLLNHPNEGLDENLITSTRLKLTDCLIAAEKIPTPHSSEPSPKPNLKSLNELNSDIESNFEGCVKQFSLELQTYFAHLFMKLNPLEFVNQQWIDHPNQTPNYTNFIETTKGLLRFCSLFILQADTEKTRTDHYKFLLTIALKALEQRNFAVAHVIFASLQLPAISRLKMTKNKKFQEKLTKLNKLLTPHNNSKSYREELVKKSTLPTIPIVELFSTDLSLQGNHPKFLLNGHLNHELLISLHGYYSLLEKQQTCLKDWDGLNHKPTYDMEMLKLTPKEFQGVEFDQFTYNLSQQHEPD
jgi:hypothetical protein